MMRFRVLIYDWRMITLAFAVYLSCLCFSKYWDGGNAFYIFPEPRYDELLGGSLPAYMDQVLGRF